ncbi:hypothetical protein ElyMa_000430300 [Elysia marginata]|uniref:Uncharacterized protein n=1 Tax=Elysia marginata TaxID=1093978 RepID=A0AAV4FNB7_9GAST|nr:hypothetical protein ElyMa_000430300 [Elysia marginata]
MEVFPKIREAAEASRYPSGGVSGNTSCFCCGPPQTDTADPEGMLNFNHQNGSQSAASFGLNFQNTLLSSSSTIFPSPTADVAMSQNEVSPLDAQPFNSLRFLQNRQIGISNSAGRPGFGVAMGEGSSMQLSTSAPISSTAINECASSLGLNAEDNNIGGRRLSEQLSSVADLRRSQADKMDLDGALDELGMLSTVTNSRRQFLLEQRHRSLGHSFPSKSYWSSKERRLRSKSESSPNLTALENNQSSGATGPSANGYHIVKINTDFVTGFYNPGANNGSGPTKPGIYNFEEDNTSGSPLISKPERSRYRNPDLLEESARRRRSIPRMSRFRKDRYRRSRCPYAIPNRLSSSMQESDFDPGFFDLCPSPYLASKPPPTAAEEALTDRLSSSLNISSASATQCPQPLSKSNTSSPAKPTGHDVRLTRSLSAENLAVRRRLEQDLCGPVPQLTVRERSSTERGLDLMTSQMTNLHMT